MIILCILLIIICLSFNITVFKFYKKKTREDVVSLIYSLLSFTDISVAVGTSFTVICLIQYLALDMKEKEKGFVYSSVKYSCYISFFISSIAVRISIFLNAMLSVVRTIMIRDPFSQPSKVGIYMALIVMTVFWTLLTTGEVYTQEVINIEQHWSDYEHDLQSEINLAESAEEDAKNRKQYLYLAALYGTFFIAFVGPCIVSIVCLIIVIQAAYLRKPSVAGSENNNKKVTNTIMMLTVVFVITRTKSIA